MRHKFVVSRLHYTFPSPKGEGFFQSPRGTLIQANIELLKTANQHQLQPKQVAYKKTQELVQNVLKRLATFLINSNFYLRELNSILKKVEEEASNHLGTFDVSTHRLKVQKAINSLSVISIKSDLDIRALQSFFTMMVCQHRRLLKNISSLSFAHDDYKPMMKAVNAINALKNQLFP